MEPRFAGLPLQLFPATVGLCRDDLHLSARNVAGKVVVALSYQVQLYQAATAQRLLDLYQELLTQAVARPDIPLQELHDLLTAAERRRTARDAEQVEAAGLRLLKRRKRPRRSLT